MDAKNSTFLVQFPQAPATLGQVIVRNFARLIQEFVMGPRLLDTFLTKIGLDRPELRAWALYDAANSAFSTTVAVAVLPIYFSDVLATDLPNHLRSAYWAYFNSFTMLMTALISPSLGYLADVRTAKKKYLALFTITGALASICLALLVPGHWKLAGLIFIIGNFSFNAGIVLYESLLPHIAKESEIHRVSNSGYALGYLGGGILLAINLLWISKPQLFGLADGVSGVKLSFISVGVTWLLLSIPLFLNVKEPVQFHLQNPGSEPFLKSASKALMQFHKTFRLLKKYPQILIFLLGFWSYSDAVGTIITMATIYGREVGIQSHDLTLAILLVQFLGVPAALAFGPLTDAIGPKKALNITLIVYILVSIVAYSMSTAAHFWMLAAGVALVQGANQAISRSIFSSLLPLSHSGEFFGLFSVSSKFAGLIGPLVFGILSAQLGNSRYSVLFLILLFVVGTIIFNCVDIEAGLKQAREDNKSYHVSPALL